MGLMQFAKAFLRIPRNRPEPDAAVGAASISRDGGLFGLPDRTDVAQYAAVNSIVESCLDVINAGVFAGRIVVVDAAGVEREGHPLTELIDNDTLSVALRAAYYTGHGVLAIGLGETTNEPVSLAPLPYQRVQTARALVNGSELLGFNVYKYRPRRGDTRVQNFLDSEVVVLTLERNPARPWFGLSPLQAAVDDVKADNDIRNLLAGYMSTYASPAGVIMPEQTGAKIGETDRLALQNALNGFRNAAGRLLMAPSKVAALDLKGGPRSTIDVGGLTAETTTRICGVMRVPPGLAQVRIGLVETQAYASVQAVMLHFAENTIAPLQMRIAAELTRKLLPLIPGSEGLTVQFDNTDNHYFRVDQVALANRLRADFTAGLITADEYRAEFGRDPLPEPVEVDNDGNADSEDTA